MEHNICLECGSTFEYLKTLGRHVRDVHGIPYLDYLEKHGKIDVRTCHCGKQFENTRVPGGERKGGPKQKHCSTLCNQRANSWWRVYGITPEQYWKMFQDQNGCCAICLKPSDEEKRILAIDHEHISGFDDLPPEQRGKYARGLLCISCNKNKMADVDLEIVKRMLAYLESYSRRSV